MDIGVWFGNGARKPRRRAKASADSYVLCIARPVMRKREGLEGLFDGRHFDREIIVLRVRLYLRYKLGLRDLVEMIAERIVAGTHYDHALGKAHYSGVRQALQRVRYTQCRDHDSGIELMHRIRKGRFDLWALRLKDTAAPAIRNAVLFNR